MIRYDINMLLALGEIRKEGEGELESGEIKIIYEEKKKAGVGL